MKKKLFSMLALLVAVVTGAVAQSYEAKVFDVPASWAEDETPLSAADLPEDFVQITEDEAKALAVPDGNVLLIYGFEGDKVKELRFASGTFKSKTEGQEVWGNLIMYQTKYNVKICYTAAPAESIDLTTTDNLTWTLASMPAYDVELEVEYYDEVTLTDGQAITALNTHAGKEIWVSYTRSFTEGTASTVCLPFAYNRKADGSFYAFTNIEKVGSDYVATMTEPISTTLTAGTPYLYLPNATGAVDFGGAYTIPAELTAGSTTNNGWTFKGTFTTIEWTTAPTGTYGFSAQTQDGISQGQFVQVGNYVRIKPMRCYLENASFAGARGTNRAAEQLPETIKVRLISANGEVNAIGTISTRTGEVTMDNDAWYSLDGRRIVGKPSTKGVYINNGNKVIIK